MNATEYAAVITQGLIEEFGPDFEFPDSFDRDCEVCLLNHMTTDAAITDLASQYGATRECASCQFALPLAIATNAAPELDDDDQWEKLAPLHSANCEWYLSRAHRLEPDDYRYID